jgi:hypothetical protein
MRLRSLHIYMKRTDNNHQVRTDNNFGSEDNLSGFKNFRLTTFLSLIVISVTKW